MVYLKRLLMLRGAIKAVVWASAITHLACTSQEPVVCIRSVESDMLDYCPIYYEISPLSNKPMFVHLVVELERFINFFKIRG